MTGQTTADWYAGVPRSTRKPTIWGCVALVGCTVGFTVWSTAAPIAGAVVTSGTFVATGQNKIVQHLEGGVIRDILVKEGDVVEQDQVLIQLDDVQPKVELRRLLLRQWRLASMEARLRAEARDEAGLAFPPSLLEEAARDPEVAELVQAQQATFEARRNAQRTEIASIEEGINALLQRIDGGNAQIDAVQQQVTLIKEELDGKEALLRTGMIRKPEVLALQRARASLGGEIGRIKGDVGDSRERISRSREQIAGVRNASVKAAVEQLHEVTGELNDVRERIRTARGILDRVQIMAPVRGAVVKLRYHTSGGVVEAGKSILEIVPAHDELLIEARVRPQDITSVKRGQKAVVRLTALRQRITPMISGEVVYLSADALPDERRQSLGTDGYIARVRLDARDAAAIPGFQPTPGMPAEVYITTPERTFFEYLAQPIKDSMSRAFREI